MPVAVFLGQLDITLTLVQTRKKARKGSEWCLGLLAVG
jgi:hypothetical protein